jgi:hypothetical protein
MRLRALSRPNTVVNDGIIPNSNMPPLPDGFDDYGYPMLSARCVMPKFPLLTTKYRGSRICLLSNNFFVFPYPTKVTTVRAGAKVGVGSTHPARLEKPFFISFVKIFSQIEDKNAFVGFPLQFG